MTRRIPGASQIDNGLPDIHTQYFSGTQPLRVLALVVCRVEALASTGLGLLALKSGHIFHYTAIMITGFEALTLAASGAALCFSIRIAALALSRRGDLRDSRVVQG